MLIDPGQTHARCHSCEESFPVDKFKLRGVNGRGKERRENYCWTCRNRRNRTRYGARTAFLYNVKRRYGLSAEQMDAMLIASCGLCGICGDPFENMKGEPHVDHCHKTSKVRDLLCARCNMMAGMVEGETARFKLVLAYLKRHRGSK